MANWDELKAKYETAHHPPNPNCRKCKGEGEWLFTPKTKSEFFSNEPYMTPCICIFVDHEYVPEIGAALAETAKKMQAEMHTPGTPTYEVIETSVKLARFLTKAKRR
jgi:hypothetical protein